jgi:hypothetical protein
VQSQPALHWTASSGATTYDVYLGTSSTPPLVTSITGTSYTPGAALSRRTTYFWKVVAKNTSGTVTSPVWSFTIR